MCPARSRSRLPAADAIPPDIAAIASAIAALFHPQVEVALHDIAADQVVAIWNNSSGRRPGDESLLDPQLLSDAPDGHVFGPYEQIDRRGRSLSSVSVRLQRGKLLLCLNFDRSALDAAMTILSTLAAPREDPPVALFQRDWRSQINTVIDDWCRAAGAARSALTREERQALVDQLEDQGVFDTRHAAAHVAAALDVSRATVYALRKQARAAARLTGHPGADSTS